MKFIRVILLLISTGYFTITNGAGRDTLITGTFRDTTISEALIFDDGGANNNIGNKAFVSTFHADNGQLDIYFTRFDIPDGAALKITTGLGAQTQLMGIFNRGAKIWNIRAKDITFEYIPSANPLNTATGWRAVANPFIQMKSTNAMLPESDCPGAIQLCSNTTVNTSANQYEDTGAINDDSGGCYSGTGSGGSVWYTFVPQANGPLDFTITPTGTTDYDFVLWDITNGCSNKTEISCNFSVETGATGLNSSGSTNSQNSSGTRINQRENVDMTHKYAICINYYSGTNGGFTLTFKNEASSVNIIDPTPPTILNAAANNCSSASSLVLTLSEKVQCSTIQAGDFTITGRTVTVTSNNCVNGGATQITVSVSPALTAGTYVLHGQDVLDFCNNNMNYNFNVVLGALPTAAITPTLLTCKSPGFFGIGWNYSPSSQTLTATGGTFYQLSDGQYNTTGVFSVSPTATTTYSVNVFNGACSAAASGVVNVETVPTGTAVASPTTVCPNYASTLSINATGASTYQWLVGGSPIGGATSSTTVVYPPVNTTYTVRLTGPLGCIANKNVTVSTHPLPAVFAGPPLGICVGGSGTLTGSTAAATYAWTPATDLSCTNCLSTVANPASNRSYTLSVTDANGCTNYSTVNVTVQNGASANISAANPVCNGATTSFSSVVLNGGTTPTFQWYQNGTAISGANTANYTTPALSTTGVVYYLMVTPGGTGQCNDNVVYSNSVGMVVNACNNVSTAGSTVTNCNGTVFDDGGSAANYTETTSFFGTGTKTTWIIINPGMPFTLNFSGYNFATNVNSPGPDVLNIYNCNTTNCTTSPIAGSPFSGTTNPGSINIANNNGIRLSFVAKAGLLGSSAAGFGASWSAAPLVCPSIIGSASVTPGATGLVYSVPAVAGATSYIWTAPPGCTVVSGDGTSSVTVNCSASATSGNMSVTVSNTCNPSCTTPLPVNLAVVLDLELLNIHTHCENDKTYINWTAYREKEDVVYILEGSMDASNFETCGTQKIESALKSGREMHVEMIHTGKKFNFYRLKQINNTNKVWYSELFTAACSELSLQDMLAYPNPAQDQLNIGFVSIENSTVNFIIHDLSGRKIKEIQIAQKVGNNRTSIDVSELSNGMYFLSLENNNQNTKYNIIRFYK